MVYDDARLEHFFEARVVLFDIGCVAGDVGNGEEFAQLPHDAVFVGQAIGVDFFDDVFCGRQNSLGFDLAADRELRRGERAIEEQGEAHGLDSEIQWIHLLGPRFIKSWKRHAGNSAYATKGAQARVPVLLSIFNTLEYFREDSAKMSQLTFNLQPDRRSLTVSELTARIRDLLAKNFTDILVEGEISNCRAAQSGHFYFTLKDEKSQVRCVWFKQQMRGVKIRPEDGLKVSVRGSVSVYEARGEYQIYVESLEPAGRRVVQLAFGNLDKQLAHKSLSTPKTKKPI